MSPPRSLELLHEAEHVLLAPVLDELSVFEADDRDAAHRDRPARRGNALEGSRVPRAHLPAPAGAVAIGQDLPDLEDRLGEGAPERREEGLHTLAARRS